MAFIWDKRSIEIACVLAKAKFSTREAAEIMGISRSALLGRSTRNHEFQFIRSSPRPAPLSREEYEARIAAGIALIEDVVLPVEPRPRVERIDQRSQKKSKRVCTSAIKAARRKGAPMPNRPPLGVEVDSQLSQREKDMIFRPDGLNEESLRYADMHSKSCKWVVSEIDGLDTMVCGRKRLKGSPYCEQHSERAYRPIPKKVKPIKALV
jgi:hypothetical protein